MLTNQASALKRTTKIPYAGKEAPKKLPVPGPTAAQAAASAADKPTGTPATVIEPLAAGTIIDGYDCGGMTDDPKKAGIPIYMQVQNRKELTDEERARVDAMLAESGKARLEQPDVTAFKTEQAALQAAKARTRKLNKAAETTGTSVPLTGKAALEAIKGTGAAKQRKPSSTKKGNGATKVAGTAKKRTSKPAGAKPATPKTDKPSVAGLRPGSKAEKIAKLLLRKDGTTAAEVMKACEWPSVSMPAQAKAAGLKLTKKKIDGVTRYYGAE